MLPRAGSHDRSARPASPVASLGVPIGSPSYAGASARTAHAPSADVGAGGDAAREAAVEGEPLATDTVAPFAPDPGMPTDGSRVEAIEVPTSARAGNEAVDLAADGPGSLGAQADVEAGGDISDAVDEGAGIDGGNAPVEPAPADAGAQGDGQS